MSLLLLSCFRLASHHVFPDWVRGRQHSDKLGYMLNPELSIRLINVDSPLLPGDSHLAPRNLRNARTLI